MGWMTASSLLAISTQFAYAQPALESANPQITQQADPAEIDFSQHFQDLGVEGSIIIHDLNQDRTYQHNPDRNTTPFLPASTFKILNSMIALETGVIAHELDVLTWDGIERSFPAWNRDQNMENAMRVSAVWFYQVLARRIGYERMQQWVTDVGYGNQNIGDADAIDTFWLTGEIRITPQEQIQFLRRLYDNDLPFSEAVMATVKDIMIVEQTPDYTIRAKTGWATQSQTGWYVGYVEQGENVYFFATNIDIRSEADLPARVELTRRSLIKLGLL
ncbi:MAG: class D beta-lactamase [Cyanobacteria bacterium P01_A01_bin.123]